MYMTTLKHTLAFAAATLFATAGLAQSAKQPAARLKKAPVRLETNDSKYDRKVKTSEASRVETLAITDFSDSDEWTVTAITPDTAVWRFQSDDELTGRFTGENIDFPTRANGYALYNFDQAVDGNTGAGPHLQYLTSPNYDVSSLDSGNVYQLVFANSHRYCCMGRSSYAYMSFSLDGGQTFSDSLRVDRYLGANEVDEGFESVRLPAGVDTATQFQIRLIFAGTFYYWAIDDISIEVLPNVDIELRDNFYAIAPNAITPFDQTEGDTIRFLVDVLNNGADTVTFNVNGEVWTLNEDNQLVDLLYIDSLLYEDVVYDSLAENQRFAGVFPMPTEQGNYAVVYRVGTTDATEPDANTDDNFLGARFVISDTIFSKVFNSISGIRSGEDDDNDWSYETGNVYYMPNPDPDSLFINSVIFQGFNRGYTDPADINIEAFVYGYLGDENGNLQIDQDEVDEVAAGTFTFDASNLGGAGDRTDFEVVFDEQVATSPDYIAYIATILYTDDDLMDGQNFFIGYGPEYGATEFASDIDITREPYEFSVLNETTAEFGFEFDALADAAPYVQLILSRERPALISTQDVLDAEQFTVAPNPADQQLFVSFDFGNEIVDADFEIVNALGQTVRTFKREGLTSGSVEVETASLRGGIYFLYVDTTEGQTATRRFNVRH